ncbi:MAG: elongation factor P [Candidatus Vogelbacteria bacterium]|nr:elongation factor P [Candidatus Vogelbacteria bacterium]
MLDYNEIKPKKFIVLDGAPYEVLEAHVFRKQQRKPVNATKLKNLITGGVREHSFAVSDKVDEAKIETKPARYLYARQNEAWFNEPNDPSQRFALPAIKIERELKLLKTGAVIDLCYFGQELISLRLPIKIDLKVTEAPAAIRGNTAQGGTKLVVLETGLMLNVPMFVNEGDTIIVNTATGEYVERV